MVRVHKAMLNAPGMEEPEVDIFLSTSKTPLRLGTVDSKGDPMIHPVWFHYSNGKFYLMSIKENRKVRNIMGKKTVYFSVDTDAEPHKGVKGKGTAVLLTDVEKSMAISEKLVAKYLGDPVLIDLYVHPKCGKMQKVASEKTRRRLKQGTRRGP